MKPRSFSVEPIPERLIEESEKGVRESFQARSPDVLMHLSISPKSSLNESFISSKHKSSLSGPSECWICFDGEGDLISPCDCKGSLKYVHVRCLEIWLKSRLGAQHSLKCELCRFEFETALRLAPFRTVLRKILRQISRNKADCLKSAIYVVYLYIFYSKTINVIKMLWEIIKHRGGRSKLNTVFSSFYLTVILLQISYLF